MNPIIPPVWLYAIHVADTVYGISIFALIISLCALLMFFLNYAVDDPDDTRKQKGLTTKGMKVCLGQMNQLCSCSSSGVSRCCQHWLCISTIESKGVMNDE